MCDFVRLLAVMDAIIVAIGLLEQGIYDKAEKRIIVVNMHQPALCKRSATGKVEEDKECRDRPYSRNEFVSRS